MSNTAKENQKDCTSHTEPMGTPKPTTGHCTPAFLRDEIQFHQPENRYKLPQQGKHHKTQRNIP